MSPTIPPRTRTVFFLAIVIAGCGPGAEDNAKPQCLSSVNTECTTYSHEFNVIHQRVLTSCASGGSSCHSREGQQGGLVLAEPDDAYNSLLGKKDGRARVKPGDPACSELVVRLDSIGQSWSMPPGLQLSEADRCAIRLWIKDGALR
jgi:hypothetical protein